MQLVSCFILQILCLLNCGTCHILCRFSHSVHCLSCGILDTCCQLVHLLSCRIFGIHHSLLHPVSSIHSCIFNISGFVLYSFSSFTSCLLHRLLHIISFVLGPLHCVLERSYSFLCSVSYATGSSSHL